MSLVVAAVACASLIIERPTRHTRKGGNELPAADDRHSRVCTCACFDRDAKSPTYRRPDKSDGGGFRYSLVLMTHSTPPGHRKPQPRSNNATPRERQCVKEETDYVRAAGRGGVDAHALAAAAATPTAPPAPAVRARKAPPTATRPRADGLLRSPIKAGAGHVREVIAERACGGQNVA